MKKLIGKGLFSKVYQISETTVLIESEDWVKECLALYVSNPLFPNLKRIDNSVYECKYYPKVKSLKNELKPEYYEVYKELRALNVYCDNVHNYYYKWREAFEKVSNEEYREALIEVIDELTNYGANIRFEISPRNVAVEDGKLILLDVFFIGDQAETVRKNKSKKYAY